MINTNTLVNRISDRIFLERSLCKEVVEALIVEIKEALADGEEVSMPTFAKFRLNKRPAFFGNIAATGEKVFYPEARKVKCVLSNQFRSCVNTGNTYLPLHSAEALKFKEVQEKRAIEKIEKEINRDNSPRVNWEKITKERALKKEGKNTEYESGLYNKENDDIDFDSDEED